jgi:hypothetical protein
MKQLLLLTFVAIFAISAIAQDDADIQKETRVMGPFTKVKTSKGINVTLIEGTKEQVEINIRNASPSDVITSLEGTMLTIKMKTMIKKGVAVTVYVTYKQLSELQAGSGSYIDNEGYLTASNLKLEVGTESVVQLKVDVTNLDASVSAGRIEITGDAKNVDLSANTGGKFNAAALEIENANLKASAGASATVRVKNKLNANASSGGKIYYYGKPLLNKSESLGGKVEPAAD